MLTPTQRTALRQAIENTSDSLLKDAMIRVYERDTDAIVAELMRLQLSVNDQR